MRHVSVLNVHGVLKKSSAKAAITSSIPSVNSTALANYLCTTGGSRLELTSEIEALSYRLGVERAQKAGDLNTLLSVHCHSTGPVLNGYLSLRPCMKDSKTEREGGHHCSMEGPLTWITPSRSSSRSHTRALKMQLQFKGEKGPGFVCH